MFATFLKIAWRNVVRNKGRSFVTMAAVAFGLTAIIFIRAFVNGADSQMVENYTNLIPGHIQIHHQGFHKKMGLERSITDIKAVTDIIHQQDNVEAFSFRIKDYALLSSTKQSTGVLLVAVDPAQEKNVTYLHERVTQGEYLQDGDDSGIVIGKDLAEILNVDLNKKVVILSQAADGSLASGAYRVRGILDAGVEEIDKGMAIITLKAAQDLLVLPDQISEVAIRLNSVYTSRATAAKMREVLDPDQYEVLSWRRISPMTAQWLDFDRAFVNAILFIVLLVVAAGILNTTLMSVFERTREFGIMQALGTKRWQLILMVSIESAVLGLSGCLIGVFLGTVLTIHFGKAGIDLAQFASAFEAYYTGSVVYPRLSVEYLVVVSVIVFFISVLVSIIPSWQVAKMKPVEAVRNF
ncbi:MAG: ABC transporter permease [Candidatus Omnitrophica bacterium]|nr:ABC transporter permease [Candidatus Omnitrophota bacterium]